LFLSTSVTVTGARARARAAHRPPKPAPTMTICSRSFMWILEPSSRVIIPLFARRPTFDYDEADGSNPGAIWSLFLLQLYSHPRQRPPAGPGTHAWIGARADRVCLVARRRPGPGSGAAGGPRRVCRQPPRLLQTPSRRDRMDLAGGPQLLRGAAGVLAHPLVVVPPPRALFLPAGGPAGPRRAALGSRRLAGLLSGRVRLRARNDARLAGCRPAGQLRRLCRA